MYGLNSLSEGRRAPSVHYCKGATTCIIYRGLEWYNLRELCERKFTATARGILHLFHSVTRVTVIDVGVDFVTRSAPLSTLTYTYRVELGGAVRYIRDSKRSLVQFRVVHLPGNNLRQVARTSCAFVTKWYNLVTGR